MEVRARWLVVVACFTCPLGCARPGRPLLTSATEPATRPVAGAHEPVGLTAAQRQRDLNQRLVLAAFRGDAGEVGRLLSAGAWGDTRFGGTLDDRRALAYPNGGMHMAAENWSPLHAAALAPGDADRVGIARLLLDAGVEPNADDGYGGTPLYAAAAANHEALALLLIARGAKVNTTTQVYIDAAEGTPLHKAAEHKNATLVRALLAAGADVEAEDTWDFTPLHDAVAARSVECARLLMEAGADVNAGGGFDRNITPLMTACDLPGRWSGRRRKGDTNVEMVRLLIDAGADVNARADVRDPFEPAEVDVRTPLLVAAEAEDLPTIRVLVAAGADVRVADEDGETPLHLIAGSSAGLHLTRGSTSADLRRMEEAARLLLEAGADRSAKNKAGETALDLAAEPFDRDSQERVDDVNRMRALLDPAGAPLPAGGATTGPTTSPSAPAQPPANPP